MTIALVIVSIICLGLLVILWIEHGIIDKQRSQILELESRIRLKDRIIENHNRNTGSYP